MTTGGSTAAGRDGSDAWGNSNGDGGMSVRIPHAGAATSAVVLAQGAAFMLAALAEGRRALPACLPNPPVGCVLVRGEAIVARGFTQPPGQPHAEAQAMQQIDGPLDDVTAYVTLEPCAFQGRTPSCARTLVERGVRRVVVAMLDPDPRNAGRGIEILRAAGAQVTVGVMEEAARQDLGPYLALPENGAPQMAE